MAKAVVGAGLVAVCLAWALVAQPVLASDAQRYIKQGSKAAALTACVEPTELMRRKHMELIKHQRDATTHHGIRGTKHSLAGCIDCHVSRGSDGQAVAVNAEHQFCNACHQFAAVNVNCFDCHASVPKGGPLSAAALASQSTEPAQSPGADPAGARKVEPGEGQ